MLRQQAGNALRVKRLFSCTALPGAVAMVIVLIKLKRVMSICYSHNTKTVNHPAITKTWFWPVGGFLQHGHYQALAQRLAQVLQKNMDTRSVSQPWQFFDAGCGEGYYMGSILAQLKSQGYMVQASGIDISKAAVQQAAKQHKNIQFAVASTFDLPLAANSQHAVVQVFAPASSAQIHRVLVDNGLWLSINPASDHLFELKSMVYDTPQQHSAELNIAEGFRLLEHQRLRFVIALHNAEQRHNLLMMTPFYWSISEEKKQRLRQHLQTVTADFSISVLAKH